MEALLPPEIGQIQNAYRFAFLAFDTQVPGGITEHSANSIVAVGTTEVPFCQFCALFTGNLYKVLGF